MQNSIILGIVIIVLSMWMYFNFFKTPESFQNQNQTQNQKNDAKRDFAKTILNYLKTDTEFEDYLSFLKKNKNTSYELVKLDTFYEFRTLKNINRLTENDILSRMKDF